MLMHTRKGTTIVTQQEKLKTKPDNRWTIYFKGSALFDPFCCLESILFAAGSFHFHTGQAKLRQAHFHSIHFLQVRYFPGKIDNRPLPGVFLEVLRPILLWRGTSRDYVARLPLRGQKKLAPLAKKLFKLDSAVVSMFFQELCHLLAIFLDCSSNRLSLSANFEAHSLQNDFFVFFHLGVVYENGQAFFFLLWRHSLPKSREKQWVLYL